MTRFMSGQRFKSLVKSGTRPNELAVRKELISNVTQISERTLRYVISTGDPDRDNDTVSVTGWDLVNFRKNPVVLWGHRGDRFPVGRAIEIGIEDGVLKATVEFAPADIPIAGDMAEACYQLSSKGFLPAVSVGFRPLEYEISNERGDADSWFPPMDFLRQELMEFSLVSVPANPDALQDDVRPDEINISATVPDVGDQEMAAREAVRKAEQARVARERRARRVLVSTL